MVFVASEDLINLLKNGITFNLLHVPSSSDLILGRWLQSKKGLNCGLKYIGSLNKALAVIMSPPVKIFIKPVLISSVAFGSSKGQILIPFLSASSGVADDDDVLFPTKTIISMGLNKSPNVYFISSMSLLLPFAPDPVNT
ncbi:putative orfan [Tupanvirus soda lake]|uniref:Orfan n=2 Tax=Tupanvirus TaxID=2094720 RepID=A0AC62ACT5_9VIRU|nr:putative orfan [Tupanvirus soda lake]QKU35602.1 putative orfan [Tupanvirus soda lake]